MEDYTYIFSRKHAFAALQWPVWQRTRDAYAGGYRYIEKALVRHLSEVDPEFAERLRRAHYFNHPQSIARRITQFTFNIEPSRKDAHKVLERDFSGTGLNPDQVMQQFETMITCYGLAWLLIDMPAVSGDVSEKDVQENRLYPFCRALSPFEVVDWYPDNGPLEWAIVEEMVVDKSNPFKEATEAVRRRLWTRDEWFLFEKENIGSCQLIGQGKHNLGIVPLIKGEETDGFGMGMAAHWFEDVVRISDSILNAESEAQMNVAKQMFGLLVIARDFAASAGRPEVVEGDEAVTTEPQSARMVIARNAAIWEDELSKGISRYIAPSGVETTTIRTEINELKKSLIDVIGLAMQSASKQAQTAESKAWDALNLQQFIASRAQMIEQCEIRAWEIINKWDKSITVPAIAYNRKFAIADLEKELSALGEIASYKIGDEFHREVLRAVLDKLNEVKQVAPEIYQKILKEIDLCAMPEDYPIPEQRIPGSVDTTGNDNDQHQTGDDE